MAWNRYSNYGGFRPYVSVATRRANAAKHAQKLAKGGTTLSPVTIAGTKIATSFWGKAWCTHLESYSDFANRLPRGRSYVRNGSVIDLQITPRDGRGGDGRRVWHRDRKRGSRGPAGRDAVGGETCPSGWEENRQPNARGKTGSAARKVRRKSKADAAVETAGKDGRVCGKNGRDRSQAGAAKKTPVTRAENDVNGAAR